MMIVILLVLVATSSLYSGGQLYARFTKSVPANGGSYREGIIGQPRFINPLLATTDTDRSIIKLVFAGLYKLDAVGNVIPDMAEAMPVVSENGQEDTGKIKDFTES